MLPYTSNNFVNNFIYNNYYASITQSVLENVENPIETDLKIASNVREGGLVIFADCYWQVIIDIEADKFTFDYIFGGKHQCFLYNLFIFPFRTFNYFLKNLLKVL